MKLYKKCIGFISAMTLIIYTFAEVITAANIPNEQYWPTAPETQSAAAIVMEANTGTILYEKNIHDVHYPASITKILTTLLAVENVEMDEVVTFSQDAVYKTEGSGIARDVGEQMTMEQCLYGVMLASANECAYAVGEHVAGDINTFVQMMNDRAAALGCQNTHFNNCNGLPDEQHYTTAYDMALIAREAYKNEAFRIICGTKTYTIPFTNKHTDEETYLQNHHNMLYPYKSSKYVYEYCTGGKTGYTVVANNTLVTYAEKDGMTLICVVLNAPTSAHYLDTRALFDFCFDNFKIMNVSENETAFTNQESTKDSGLGSYEPFVSLDPSGSVILPKAAEFTDATSEIIYNNADENILGSIRYTYANRLVGGADITATNATVDALPVFKQGEAVTDTTETASDTESAGKEQKEEKIIQIHVKQILMVVLALAGLVICIFLGWKFVDNFYYIKRKLRLNKKTKSPYKVIKKNRMYRKKGRRR